MNINITTILTSISKLNAGGNLDVEALKAVSKEMVSVLSGALNETDFQKNQITFLFDLLQNLKLISKEDKLVFLEDLKIKYTKENESINDLIISMSRDMSEEQKEAIRRNSSFKGVFKSLEELEAVHPPTRSAHNWRAIVSPETHEDVWKRGELQEYLFTVDTMSWIPVNDPTYLRNYKDRTDKSINGREKGLPLNFDILTYVKDEYKWKPYTREELDLASKEILEFLISSVLQIKDNEGRYRPLTKTEALDSRLSRLNKGTDFYKDFMNDIWLVDHKSFSDIVNQINTDYAKKIKLYFDDGSNTNGMIRPQLFRENNLFEVVNEEVKYLVDYDTHGLLNKHMDNPTFETLLKVINDDFNRKHLILIDSFEGVNKNRLKPLIASGAETTVELDPLVPKNITGEDVNKVINQVNFDYHNSIKNIPTETYNTYLQEFLTENITNTAEKDKVFLRLRKAGNIIKEFVKGPIEEENKRITIETLNSLITPLKNAINRIDMNRDEIFERDNTFNGKKTFNGETIFKGVKNTFENKSFFSNSVEITGETTLRGNLHVIGGKILFSEITSMLNIQSPTTVIRDAIVELNRPTVEDGVPKPIEFERWIETNNNGYGGLKVFRGEASDLNTFYFGYSENRKAMVAGFLPKNPDKTDAETEANIENLNRLAWVDYTMSEQANGRVAMWKSTTQSFTFTTDLWGDVEGCTFKKFAQLDSVITANSLAIGKFVTLIGQNLFVSDLSSSLKADTIGFIRTIKKITGTNQSSVEVVLSGVTPLNNSFVAGSTLYLQPNGTIGTSLEYAEDSTYLVKTIGKVLDPSNILVRIDKTENYKSFSIDNANETNENNFNAEMSNIISLPARVPRMTPLALTENGYETYSISVHKNNIIGFAEDLGGTASILLTNRDRMYFANNSNLPIGTTIYMDASNQLIGLKNRVRVGTLVSLNQILLDIYVEKEAIVEKPVGELPSKDNVVLPKTTINLNTNDIVSLDLKEHTVYEMLALNTANSTFNSMYSVIGEDSLNIVSINGNYNLGVFYLDNEGAEHKVKYKALGPQILTINYPVLYTVGSTIINPVVSINK